jgi:SAM-dependent methyltransferase
MTFPLTLRGESLVVAVGSLRLPATAGNASACRETGVLHFRPSFDPPTGRQFRDVCFQVVSSGLTRMSVGGPMADIATVRESVVIWMRSRAGLLPMAQPQIRYDDGAAYERMMGAWSRIAGEIFLDWLTPPPGLRWIDIGCGSGAFTELLVERCAPAEVQAIDPSEAQLSFARARPAGRIAQFHRGDALALPFGEDSFDAAVMALVIFFVPDPTKAVAEMKRVVCPGGTVAAYVWDMMGGGHPLELMHAEMLGMGVVAPRPPRSDASSVEALRGMWMNAGLDAPEVRDITVQRTFADFEDYWTTSTMAATVSQTIAAMAPGDTDALKMRMRARLPADAAGRITQHARANAIRGRVPK